MWNSKLGIVLGLFLWNLRSGHFGCHLADLLDGTAFQGTSSILVVRVARLLRSALLGDRGTLLGRLTSSRSFRIWSLRSLWFYAMSKMFAMATCEVFDDLLAGLGWMPLLFAKSFFLITPPVAID